MMYKFKQKTTLSKERTQKRKICRHEKRERRLLMSDVRKNLSFSLRDEARTQLSTSLPCLLFNTWRYGVAQKSILQHSSAFHLGHPASNTEIDVASSMWMFHCESETIVIFLKNLLLRYTIQSFNLKLILKLQSKINLRC